MHLRSVPRRTAGRLLLACLLPIACVNGVWTVGPDYSWFAPPTKDDRWAPRIQGWQERTRKPMNHLPGPRIPATRGSLARQARTFQLEARRETARSVSLWMQDQSRHFFVSDPGVDHWPTVDEVFASNGDDCDGLSFVARELLLDLGLPDAETWLSIVHRSRDDTYHMVILWFEEQDPWVIDPTGAMTAEMDRLSALPDWQPLAIFSEKQHFSVREPLPQVAAEPPRP